LIKAPSYDRLDVFVLFILI